MYPNASSSIDQLTFIPFVAFAIFTVGVTGSANGVTSFNPVINGSRTAINTRSSVPIGSSLQTNAQSIVPLTVETAATYTFNIHEYANAANVASTAGLYIYKLS